MHTVMPPRFLRPRLLLLPLVCGVLAASAQLTTADGNHALYARAFCKSVTLPVRKPEVPRKAPNCVNCRAPLLNAPLARAEPAAPGVRQIALPPAA
jgi:hypothetical protein